MWDPAIGIPSRHPQKHERWNADGCPDNGFFQGLRQSQSLGHNHLLEKLKFYGIRGKTNTWIRDFLSNRRQVVVVEGEKSYAAEVKSGVPQGSVLGPSLFLFYINDIEDNMESTVRLFADDTIVYLAVSSTQDAETLQNDLNKLGIWERKWHMEFHPEKCQVLTITRKRKPIVYNHTLHEHTLEHVETAK